MKRILLLVLFLVPVIALTEGTTPVEDESIRVWTSARGSKIKAALVSYKNGIVKLKKEDGSLVKIRLEMLSKPDQALATIPKDANEFRGHHYMLYTDETDWRRARFNCQKRGGHLVVINDSPENDFVYELLKEQRLVWIGLYQSMRSWRWVGIADSGFFKWAPDEPDVNKDSARVKVGADLCVAMYGERPFGSSTYSYSSRNEMHRSRWSVRESSNPEITGYICEWDN